MRICGLPRQARDKQSLGSSTATAFILSQDNPLNERRPDLALVEAGCPAPLLSLVERCWVDVPTERPSVEEFIEVLRVHELEAVADAEQRKVSSCRGECVSVSWTVR
jgi:hypothetical protein